MPYKSQKQYRYKGYNYAQDGFYFVTICCKNREMFFGDVIAGKMQLSKIGKIAEKFYLKIPDHFLFIKLDKFVIMPNHIHGIIEIDNETAGIRQCNVGTGQCPVPTNMNANKNNGSTFGHVTPKSLSVIVGSFKSATTKNVNLKFNETGFAWQKRFYDRIIRNNDELNRIRQYIMDNPLRWELDRNNSDGLYM